MAKKKREKYARFNCTGLIVRAGGVVKYKLINRENDLSREMGASSPRSFRESGIHGPAAITCKLEEA